jgi:hypothetical protein
MCILGVFMRFEIAGDYRIGVEDFWSSVFFEPAFNDYLHSEGLGFKGYEITAESVETDGSRTRSLTAYPSTPIPRPLQRVIGKSISYMETGRFDPSDQCWITEVEVPTLGKRLSLNSRMSFHQTGSNRCQRKVVFNIEAHILGVGRMVEKFIASALRDNYEAARVATNQWIKDNI